MTHAVSRVRVIGSDGNVINTGYSANLEAGTVTFSDVSGYAQPVTIEHRIEEPGRLGSGGHDSPAARPAPAHSR